MVSAGAGKFEAQLFTSPNFFSEDQVNHDKNYNLGIGTLVKLARQTERNERFTGIECFPQKQCCAGNECCQQKERSAGN